MTLQSPSQKNKQVDFIEVEESPDAVAPPDAADLAGGFAQSPELVTPPKRSLGQDQLESTEKRPCKRRLSFKAVAARCSEVFQAQKLVGSGLWHSPFQIGGRYFSCAIRADDESNLMNLARKWCLKNLQRYLLLLKLPRNFL